MIKSLTIIIRTKGNEDIKNTIESIRRSFVEETYLEIVVISFSNENATYIKDGVRYYLNRCNRAEAKKIGVDYANAEYVLFLDSDQIISKDLIIKLQSLTGDMIFIPERTYYKHFVANLMDNKRTLLERRMKQKIDVYIPVIPRVFKRELIKSVFDAIDDSILHNLIWPEDSVIFYEALKLSRDITWADSYIYNVDPYLPKFIKKSYYYGKKSEEITSSETLPLEYVNLIRKIQFESLINNRLISLQLILINTMRGIPYVFGLISSHLLEGGKK